MSMVVHKYPLPFGQERDEYELDLPPGAEFVHFAMQGDTPTVWVQLRPDKATTRKRTLRLAGTGHPLDYIGIKHIGSALAFDAFARPSGRVVWHLFEVLG